VYQNISVAEEVAASIFNVEKSLVLRDKGGKRKSINGRGVR